MKLNEDINAVCRKIILCLTFFNASGEKGDGDVHLVTHRKLEEGVRGSAVHVQFGLQERWEGRPVTQRLPVAGTLKSNSYNLNIRFTFFFNPTTIFKSWVCCHRLAKS